MIRSHEKLIQLAHSCSVDEFSALPRILMLEKGQDLNQNQDYHSQPD